MSIYARVAFGEQDWLEYTYKADGFSIKLPYSPKPHPDSNNPNLTNYTIRLAQDELVIVRVVRDERPCSETLATLTKMSAEKRFRVLTSSFQGYKTIEEEHESGAQRIFERNVCTGRNTTF